MKNVLLTAIMALMLVGAVSATNGVLSDESVTMGYNDSRIVEYCLDNDGTPVTYFPVVIDVVWQEFDNVLGYSAGDVANPTGFDATLMAAQTDGTGCVDIQLNTYDESGTFGYSVNGDNGKTLVGNEIGQVLVPEFGVLAALGVLGLAGLFIYRKRQ